MIERKSEEREKEKEDESDTQREIEAGGMNRVIRRERE